MDMARIVKQLETERRAAEKELDRITSALQALRGMGKIKGTRMLSKEARKRIGDAQRARWAKTRRPQKKGPQPVSQKAA